MGLICQWMQLRQHIYQCLAAIGTDPIAVSSSREDILTAFYAWFLVSTEEKLQKLRWLAEQLWVSTDYKPEHSAYFQDYDASATRAQESNQHIPHTTSTRKPTCSRACPSYSSQHQEHKVKGYPPSTELLCIIHLFSALRNINCQCIIT